MRVAQSSLDGVSFIFLSDLSGILSFCLITLLAGSLR